MDTALELLGQEQERLVGRARWRLLVIYTVMVATMAIYYTVSFIWSASILRQSRREYLAACSEGELECAAQFQALTRLDDSSMSAWALVWPAALLLAMALSFRWVVLLVTLLWAMSQPSLRVYYDEQRATAIAAYARLPPLGPVDDEVGH